MKQLLVPILLAANLVVSSTVLALAVTGRLAPAAAPDEELAAEEVEEPKQVFYHEFKPELTVNFPGDGRPRYMQVSLTAVTYDEAVLEELQRHSPAINNELLLLFSGVEPDPLTTREGKKELLSKALETVRAIMLARYGEGAVEDMYFTRFVMQ
jgi:flagellar FliL protein